MKAARRHGQEAVFSKVAMEPKLMSTFNRPPPIRQNLNEIFSIKNKQEVQDTIRKIQAQRELSPLPQSPMPELYYGERNHTESDIMQYDRFNTKSSRVAILRGKCPSAEPRRTKINYNDMSKISSIIKTNRETFQELNKNMPTKGDSFPRMAAFESDLLKKQKRRFELDREREQKLAEKLPVLSAGSFHIELKNKALKKHYFPKNYRVVQERDSSISGSKSRYLQGSPSKSQSRTESSSTRLNRSYL